MVTFDWDSYEKRIAFVVKHYGTKTQGEDFRLSQVAHMIREMTEETFYVINHLADVKDLETRFKISMI